MKKIPEQADVCKIKMESNLKENWLKKGKINEVVKRGEIIHNFKKLKTKEEKMNHVTRISINVHIISISIIPLFEGE